MFKTSWQGRVAIVAGAIGIAASLGCTSKSSTGVPLNNIVTSTDPQQEKAIGDADTKLVVMGFGRFQSRLSSGSIKKAGSPEVQAFLAKLSQGVVQSGSSQVSPVVQNDPASQAQSLLLGYPVGLLNQQNVFGGVITKVGDKNDANLGGLKLTDLTPVHVRTMIVDNEGNQPSLGLVGCAEECTELSEQKTLFKIPIVGVDPGAGLIVLDLATLGQSLDIIAMLDPDGSATGLKPVGSQTVLYDFSISTLVFDIETKVIPVDKPEHDPDVKPVVLTTRWYLKLSSVFNPGFTSRLPTEGVGFFQTARGKEAKINHWSLTSFGGNPVKYYIKNVPAEHRPAFQAAFDEWNTKLKPVIGREVLAYEFVEPTDSRFEILVPGDVRYNVLEWDLDNKAGYGGLGPSISNQFTGEIFNATVLIQGPTIIALYTDWFKVKKEIDMLRAAKQIEAADQLEKDFAQRWSAATGGERAHLQVKLGILPMDVRAQDPRLEDPLAQRNDFEDLPTETTYEQYMHGYFIEMVAHELGHNLGLRHNFVGNLGASDGLKLGGQSWSVMEYLGRPFRWLDRVGPYDLMALSYSFLGTKPTILNHFCTDEDAITAGTPQNSAECSRDDATNDPFSYLMTRLMKVTDRVVGRGSIKAPVWGPDDLAREMGAAQTGLLAYASSHKATGAKWLSFFGKADRPADVDGVPAYVLAKIKSVICDPSLVDVIAQKESDDVRAATFTNLSALRDKAVTLAQAMGAFAPSDLACK